MLEGKIAIVTGGNRGIGAAVVEALKGDGAYCISLSRSGDQGPADQGLPCDVTDEDSVRANIDHIVAEQGGKLDILVNNAGVSSSAPIAKTPTDLWRWMIEVNLTGTFFTMREVIPHLVRRGGGRIVNVASTAAKTGAPYIGAYAASKHGVLGLTRSVALEVASKNITVNAVCPSYVDTEMTGKTIENIVEKTGKTNEEARAILEEFSPQGRLYQPEEIASVVRYLVSDAAAGINGQGINIDGGENFY